MDKFPVTTVILWSAALERLKNILFFARQTVDYLRRPLMQALD
jgi:hypothetical protein